MDLTSRHRDLLYGAQRGAAYLAPVSDSDRLFYAFGLWAVHPAALVEDLVEAGLVAVATQASDQGTLPVMLTAAGRAVLRDAIGA